MRFNRFQISGAIAGMALLASSTLLSISPSTATSTQQPTSTTKEFQIPPGGRQVGNQIVYENGNVVLEFAPSRTRLFGSRCPRGWFCIFEHANWWGAMWRFRQPGLWQSLTQYNAAYRMSSYHNQLPYTVAVRYSSRSGSFEFPVGPNSRSSYVGSLYNDKAYAIKIR